MPVYNEADTVGCVLDAVREHFSGEIVVIDDGSTDKTPMVLAQRNDVAVVHLDHNCGYGCALRIGFDVARELGVSHVVTMDCDGQHEPAHIPEFLAGVQGGTDIVSGSRYLPASGTVGTAPADRQEINARITEEINRVTGWSLTDAFCGFKAYRLQALAGLSLTESGYAMPLELWARAWHHGLKVEEIAVERIYCDRDRSFGVALDDPEKRYAYYMEVWRKALESR
ncbi:MAG: glycosyltransferase family 2 protein [Actinobacteria bacterium HGW-Actinobacteria-7]|jgi:dolichol-phosphate mannosyltransferase|nr:MAG: glycosyltransferase family 2 protein [Actinobacteria bacterium HGW-Actinobacteria-7]